MGNPPGIVADFFILSWENCIQLDKKIIEH